MVSISHATTISPESGIRSFSVRDFYELVASRIYPKPLITLERKHHYTVSKSVEHEPCFHIALIFSKNQHFCAFIQICANSPTRLSDVPWTMAFFPKFELGHPAKKYVSFWFLNLEKSFHLLPPKGRLDMPRARFDKFSLDFGQILPDFPN